MSGELILALIGIVVASVTAVLACTMPIYLSRKKTLLQHKIDSYVQFLDFSNIILAEFFKKNNEPIHFSMENSFKIMSLATQVSLFSGEKIAREIDEFIETIHDYEVNSTLVATYKLPVIHDEQLGEASINGLLKKREEYEQNVLIAITQVTKKIKSITSILRNDLYGAGKSI